MPKMPLKKKIRENNIAIALCEAKGEATNMIFLDLYSILTYQYV